MSKLQFRTFTTYYISTRFVQFWHYLLHIYYYFLGCGWVAFEMWGFELRVGVISTRMSKLQFRTFPTQARITQVLDGAAQQKKPRNCLKGEIFHILFMNIGSLKISSNNTLSNYSTKIIESNPLWGTFQYKGQLISKCPFVVIVWTKIPMKKFNKFLP